MNQRMPSTKQAWKCSSVLAVAASTGREVLLSSHDGEVLEELADRVYCMRDGAVVEVQEKVVSAMKKTLDEKIGARRFFAVLLPALRA